MQRSDDKLGIALGVITISAALGALFGSPYRPALGVACLAVMTLSGLAAILHPPGTFRDKLDSFAGLFCAISVLVSYLGVFFPLSTLLSAAALAVAFAALSLLCRRGWLGAFALVYAVGFLLVSRELVRDAGFNSERSLFQMMAESRARERLVPSGNPGPDGSGS